MRSIRGLASGPASSTRQLARMGSRVSCPPSSQSRTGEWYTAGLIGRGGLWHAAEKVSLKLKMRIMKARQAKGMTQKELATVSRLFGAPIT